jgi:drug/metabolite transporter (DMT)-like permease
MAGGVFNCICIYLFTYASQHSAPTTLALLRYIGVFYSFLFDLFIFEESFSFIQLFGVSLILVTNIASVAYKLKKQLPKISESKVQLVTEEIEIGPPSK